VIDGARYIHTNLIARDWRALARFYEHVFGCIPVLPERNLHGPDLEAGTGVSGARLEGVHLRFPGFGVDGPTLEIFQYAELAASVGPAVNRPGFAHLAFSVPSVAEARRHVLASGGSAVGQIVTTAISDEVSVTWCYVTDPEGNIIELQSPKREPAV
jgi:predicted enzyme related to lactoylglutathione lyase